MTFTEDEKGWKRVGIGAIIVPLFPFLVVISLIVFGLYRVGKSFDEYLERHG